MQNNKLKLFFKYYYYNIVCLICWALLAGVIDQIITKSLGVSIWQNHSSVSNMIKVNGFLYSLFFLVIKMPIIEELAFRLWLSFKKIDLSIGLFFFLYIMTGFFISEKLFHYRIATSLVIPVIFFFVINKQTDNTLFLFRDKNITIIKQVSMVFFGLLHISNFIPLNHKILFIYPIFVIPQIIVGYFLVKIRIEMGIKWAILFHAFNNLLVFLPYLILKLVILLQINA